MANKRIEEYIHGCEDYEHCKSLLMLANEVEEAIEDSEIFDDILVKTTTDEVYILQIKAKMVNIYDLDDEEEARVRTRFPELNKLFYR